MQGYPFPVAGGRARPGHPRINWSHPLAPRTRQGILVAGLNGGTPVDLVANRAWTSVGTAMAYPTPALPPGLSGPGEAMRFNGSTAVTQYTAPGAPTSFAGITLAAIFRADSLTTSQNRLLSNSSTNSSISLCAAYSGSPVKCGFNRNSVGIGPLFSSPVGGWYFLAGSLVTATNVLTATFYDYARGTWGAATVTGFAPTTPDGSFALGSTTGSAQQFDGALAWAMIDYYAWSAPDLAALALAPWAPLSPGAVRGLVVSAPAGTAGNASGPAPSLFSSAPAGLATGQANASGAAPSLAPSAPSGQATGQAGASGTAPALSPQAPAGSGTGSAVASGQSPAIAPSAPAGSASGGTSTGGTASGAAGILSPSAPAGQAAGDAAASGLAPALAPSAPAGTASTSTLTRLPDPSRARVVRAGPAIDPDQAKAKRL